MLVPNWNSVMEQCWKYATVASKVLVPSRDHELVPSEENMLMPN